ILFMFRCVVVVVVFVGGVVKRERVWNRGELFMGLMRIVKIIWIIGVWNVGFGLMKDYEKEKKEGKKGVFKGEKLEIKLFGISGWGGKKYKKCDK
ncbi:alanine:cation symporter family protein, partial [Staphylococcus aureus]|uniref:alanine:cation symporter family protein n=1 Tax=Staphylococcus aureus TaxID=1280 RepID=UPI00119D8F9B